MRTDTPIGSLSEPCHLCGAPVETTLHADPVNGELALYVDKTNQHAHDLEHGASG